MGGEVLAAMRRGGGALTLHATSLPRHLALGNRRKTGQDIGQTSISVIRVASSEVFRPIGLYTDTETPSAAKIKRVASHVCSPWTYSEQTSCSLL